jgi:hypothetical protein
MRRERVDSRGIEINLKRAGDRAAGACRHRGESDRTHMAG